MLSVSFSWFPIFPPHRAAGENLRRESDGFLAGAPNKDGVWRRPALAEAGCRNLALYRHIQTLYSKRSRDQKHALAIAMAMTCNDNEDSSHLCLGLFICLLAQQQTHPTRAVDGQLVAGTQLGP